MMADSYNIYIIFGESFGFFDLEAIQRLINNHTCEKVMLFLKNEPHKNILNSLKSISSIKINVSENPKKDARRYKKDFAVNYKNVTSALFPLEVVADRSMFLDVC